jgi:hypothetical protein
MQGSTCSGPLYGVPSLLHGNYLLCSSPLSDGKIVTTLGSRICSSCGQIEAQVPVPFGLQPRHTGQDLPLIPSRRRVHGEKTRQTARGLRRYVGKSMKEKPMQTLVQP